MDRVGLMGDVSIRDFERFHARLQRKPTVRPSLKELGFTVLTALIVTPFFFVTFFVLPMMGQITVGLAAIITAFYLFYRRSLLVFIATVGGVSIFSTLTFSTIQAIKYRLEIPLFVFLVLGIPMTFAYCVFIGYRIWVLRGGAD
jgi:hypothetical protein